MRPYREEDIMIPNRQEDIMEPRRKKSQDMMEMEERYNNIDDQYMMEDYDYGMEEDMQEN